MYYLKKKKKGGSQNPLVAKLDRLFSQYIRLRDTMPNGYGKCISCGKIKTYDQMDCGHFHSRRHMATRFDEDNAHAECRYCNRFSADHLIGYERNLIIKIGKDRFDRLNFKAHSACHWLDPELNDKIDYYKAAITRLQNKRQ